MDPDGKSKWRSLALLALLVAIAYARLWRIPLLEDDFSNLWQSLEWGPPAHAGELFGNATFRLRSTSYWLMYALWQWAKLSPFLYHAASIGIHVANTWLLYALGRAWPRMRRAAFWAAAFFAVHEGHQEAVMWFSAVNELLVFFFGAIAIWCWLKRDRGWVWRVASIVAFALALLSKESAIVLLPLFVLVRERTDWRRTVWQLAPYLVLSGVAVLSIVESRTSSFRFSDGSFDLHAPFWLIWPRNYFRVLWIWGVPATAALIVARDRALRTAGLTAAAWIGIGLAPYCFLTYSMQIPSRQMYLASAGLAMLIGLAVAWWWERQRRVVAVILVAMLVHNVDVLWVRKRHQFLERAAPTEALIQFARQNPSPIWVRCFPRNHYIAEGAVYMGAGRSPAEIVWSEEEAKARGAREFCFEEQH